MKINQIEDLFRELWEMYGNSISMDRDEMIINNNKLIEEFFFVVLGGYGISYELNKSGLNVLSSKKILTSELFQGDNIEVVEEIIKEEFSKKQFEPMTKNNELRKYRFIKSKPRIVASAGNWLWNECEWDLQKWLKDNRLNSREQLCKCPGIGMKSASWFLRNIGYNDNYAVFDVHILRFISKIGIDVPEVITDKRYTYLEGILREVCTRIGISLGKMDYLLWILGRNGYLEYVRCN